jgi:hypothetical protein
MEWVLGASELGGEQHLVYYYCIPPSDKRYHRGKPPPSANR